MAGTQADSNEFVQLAEYLSADRNNLPNMKNNTEQALTDALGRPPTEAEVKAMQNLLNQDACYNSIEIIGQVFDGITN